MRADFEIVGSFNNQRVTSISAERNINLFEYLDPKGKRPHVLLPTSGLSVPVTTDFSTASGGFRAQFVFGNFMYMVVGADIWRCNTSLVFTNLGTINTSSGYVGVDANTTQVIFVDGEDGWIYDTDEAVLAQILDPSFPENPVDVTSLDGFFVVANGGSPNFQLSHLNQGFVWSSGNLNFAVADVSVAADTITLSSTTNFPTGMPVTFSTTDTIPAGLDTTSTFYTIQVNATTIQVASTLADALSSTAINLTSQGIGTHTITNDGQLQQGSISTHPGNIVACRTLHRRLFLFSENFTEVWENAGAGANLPFRRNNSLLMEVGTAAIGSVDVGFDRMYFLSQDSGGLGSVMMVEGAQPISISSAALDFIFADFAFFSGVSEARGIVVKENGVIFYRLNFTVANYTYVFNVSMSDPQNLRWHEEEILNRNRHPAQTHAFFSDINFYGHYASPILYIVDSTFVTNAGEAIRRMRISKPYSPEGYRRIRIDRFHLDLLQGDLGILNQNLVSINVLSELAFNLLTEASVELLAEQDANHPITVVPEVFLSFSKDGGQTFGNVISAPMGSVGERTFRTVWRKLGVIPRGQAFVPRIEFYNKSPFVVLGASWDFEILPE